MIIFWDTPPINKPWVGITHNFLPPYVQLCGKTRQEDEADEGNPNEPAEPAERGEQEQEQEPRTRTHRFAMMYCTYFHYVRKSKPLFR